MITLVEARGYRCLEHVRQPLGRHQVLAGPIGSGKSTFLDVISFLGALIERGPEAALRERADDPRDLGFGRAGQPVELAVEASIPEALRRRLGNPAFETLRYEIGLDLDDKGEIGLSEERVSLKTGEQSAARQLEMFPGATGTILAAKPVVAGRTVVHKVQGGNDNFYSETYGEPGKGWLVGYRLGRRRSALSHLPEDETKFPGTIWFKRLLAEGVHRYAPDARKLRRPSRSASRGRDPARAGAGLPRLRADARNLPWVVAALAEQEPERVESWVQHLEAALPGLAGVSAPLAEGDLRRALSLRYRGGLEVPARASSDGALRLLALTLPGFLPEIQGVWLVEEPEDGLHPAAAAAAARALAGARGGQVLVTTQAPAVLAAADPDRVLCFARDEGGGTRITAGREHTGLAGWQAGTPLPALGAGGALE